MFSEMAKVVGQWIANHIPLSAIIFLLLLTGVFKITKIEINPIGWIISWIGKFLTKETTEKVKNLKDDMDTFKGQMTKEYQLVKKRLDQIEKSNDLQSVRQIRTHVLDFANSCMNGRKHTQKDFDNLFEEDREYQKLVKKHKIVNARYKEDFEFIIKCYHKCQEENSFLKESTSQA